MWEWDGTDGHEGDVGVVLEDGSEPGPVYFDTGSGGNFHKSTDWWIYDGTFGAPVADRMRARCACGWRGAENYPIDWSAVERRRPYTYDTSGPEEDWQAHMADVTRRTVPLPEDLARLLGQLRERLVDMEDDDPLVILRVVRELESITASAGPYAARLTQRQALSDAAVAEALGVTEKKARSRLNHYTFMHS